ncbi:hypothetical protein [Galactobacter valiniphilus]|nr:hypothetical protein [Galactobacter valiniphilus]
MTSTQLTPRHWEAHLVHDRGRVMARSLLRGTGDTREAALRAAAESAQQACEDIAEGWPDQVEALTYELGGSLEADDVETAMHERLRELNREPSLLIDPDEAITSRRLSRTQIVRHGWARGWVRSQIEIPSQRLLQDVRTLLLAPTEVALWMATVAAIAIRHQARVRDLGEDIEISRLDAVGILGEAYTREAVPLISARVLESHVASRLVHVMTKGVQV